MSEISIKNQYERFRLLRFPPDSESEEINALRAELAEYEGFIAGHVETLIAHGSVHRVDLRFDDSLRERIEIVVSSARGQHASDAERLLNYCFELEELISVAWRTCQ